MTDGLPGRALRRGLYFLALETPSEIRHLNHSYAYFEMSRRRRRFELMIELAPFASRAPRL